MSSAAKLQPILPSPIQISNVLLATDFSVASETALDYAQAIAAQYGAKLHALHVLPGSEVDNDEARVAAADKLAAILRRDALKNVTREQLLEEGEAQTVIPTSIRQFDIDMLVLGTHQRRSARKLLLGSMAEEIFRVATCPVLTVGPESGPARLNFGDFPHIVFATDFSASSVRALPYALSLAQKSQARLTMLHVIQEVSDSAMEYLDAITSACRQRLTELLPAGAGSWCRPDFVVEFGPAADMVLKVAEEEQADLIVMGAKLRPARATTYQLPWPTSYLVSSQAPCPVLTVRS